jgi:hypothetical protein
VQAGPPLVPFVLAVGVTGHRADMLAAGSLDQLRARIDQVLALIETSGRRLQAEAPARFAGGGARMRFVSPIADGADQIAAEVALERGWELQVILPFQREAYRATLANHGARERFDALVRRAACVLELPGDTAQGLEAYVMTGRATVAHCDLMIAIWDGLPPRGRGGTGEVVQLALTKGTAIVHVPLVPDGHARLLWSAFDPTVMTVADDFGVARPLEPADIEAVLRGLLMPPAGFEEEAFLNLFLHERLRRIRARFEYPLLLTAAGVRPFRVRDLTSSHADAQTRDEWRRYRVGCVEAHNISAPIDIVEEAYSWADGLAAHFAQTYRSGHIFNFLLGGIAVCLGLATFMTPRMKIEEAALELLITLAIIVNAIIGKRHEWHRRWLDYRQLAERLRPMRTLKLLGIAAPDPPGTGTNPVPRRWIDWYASSIWRAMGCSAGSIDRNCAAELGRAIADHEVKPQVSYHEKNAHQIELLDRRLEQIGIVLFAGTVLVTIATVVGLSFDSVIVNEYGNWFTLVSAGFPALGTAIFGIRFQGDFGGDALRSMATADTLRQIDHELRQDVSLMRAADLAEQAARVMLSDLDEWRLINQQRDLSVG